MHETTVQTIWNWRLHLDISCSWIILSAFGVTIPGFCLQSPSSNPQVYILSILRISAFCFKQNFTPFRPSNFDFGYIKVESTAGYTFTPMCGISCLPWHRHSGRNVGFTFHSKDEAIEVKWLAQGHKRGGPWQVSNPKCLDHEFDALTTRPCRPAATYEINQAETVSFFAPIYWKPWKFRGAKSWQIFSISGRQNSVFAAEI
jgi:hypothetical protein